MSDKADNGLVDLVVEQLENTGVSSAKVNDGRLWLFKREFLEKMLAKHPDQKVFQILIQDREFEN